MKSLKWAVLVAAASLSSGCSLFSSDEQEAAKAIEKPVNNRESGLKTPPGFKNPVVSDEYTLIEGPKKFSAEDEMTSPTSVLVLLDKSWINADDPHPSRIMIEKPDLVDDLRAFTDKGIKSYVETFNAELVSQNGDTYRISLPIKVETGFWFWKTDVTAEKYVFDVNVALQSHGRSGTVTVDTVSYEKVNTLLASSLSEDIRRSSLAVQTLNDVMLEMDYLHRITVKEEIATLDVTLTVGKDLEGNDVLTSQQDIVSVWKQMEDVVEQLGFDIEDEDKELFVYSMTYEKGNQSTWDSLFNSEVANKLDIETGEYEMQLTTTVEGVHIKFRSKNGLAFNSAQIQQAYELIMMIIKEDELEI